MPQGETMKHKLLAPACLIAATLLFSACTATPTLELAPNWYSNTGIRKDITGTSEDLVYTVTFTAGEQEGFSVAYEDGTYTTSLRDEMSTADRPIEGVPIGVPCYHLHAELSIRGRYTVGGATGEEFSDSVVSDIWFMDATSALFPLYSKKTVHSTSPRTTAETVEEAGVLYHYSYTAQYDPETRTSHVVYDDLESAAAPEEWDIRLGKGTFLDNEEYLFALRGFNMQSAPSFQTVNPLDRSVVTLMSDEVPTLEERTYKFAINASAEEDRKLNTASLSVHYSGTFRGREQELTYAVCTDPAANTYRNVLLHMKTYAPESLGAFDYTLRSATFNTK